ncbi:MAG TPA: KUP/HAK/KT family potassium transporter, partial [Polyangiaceae bacterium]|nr:KUP/HAK/KT family potassium transporter [Polyangiaceae bacterium]
MQQSSHDSRLRTGIAALGVVFGDIGTSPLYAVRECFNPKHGVTVSWASTLGVCSLIVWALILIVTLKYIAYVLRADDKGEGGVLALLNLSRVAVQAAGKSTRFVVTAGLLGAALLFSDGMITPAISVLSAVEGLGTLSDGLAPAVVPLTVVILLSLFLIQRQGTRRVGLIFGPVMLVWFASLAGLGVFQILRHPEILVAISPVHAWNFVHENGKMSVLVLGAVFLVVTGSESLYADLGHFGLPTIRTAWLFVVLPALTLNYLGQGALLLAEPDAREDVFFRMAPEWALAPLIVLSTFAAVVASQALISGAFSLMRQATMLGFWPRVGIRHTSASAMGQIYVPAINWLLMIGAMGLVIGFGNSSALASVYGLAVSATMLITTLLAYAVARYVWGVHWTLALCITLCLAVIETAFLGANLLKIGEGGWFSLVIAAAFFALMTTWRRGQQLMAERRAREVIPLQDFFEVMRIEMPARVPGTAVFLAIDAEGAPITLMQNFTHNRVVHRSVIILSVVVEQHPRVPVSQRVQVEKLSDGFYRVRARYGFMQQPDIPAALALLEEPEVVPPHTTYFVGRTTFLAESAPGMSRWRIRLYRT